MILLWHNIRVLSIFIGMYVHMCICFCLDSTLQFELHWASVWQLLLAINANGQPSELAVYWVWHLLFNWSSIWHPIPCDRDQNLYKYVCVLCGLLELQEIWYELKRYRFGSWILKLFHLVIINYNHMVDSVFRNSSYLSCFSPNSQKWWVSRLSIIRNSNTRRL